MIKWFIFPASLNGSSELTLEVSNSLGYQPKILESVCSCHQLAVKKDLLTLVKRSIMHGSVLLNPIPLFILSLKPILRISGLAVNFLKYQQGKDAITKILFAVRFDMAD